MCLIAGVTAPSLSPTFLSVHSHFLAGLNFLSLPISAVILLVRNAGLYESSRVPALAPSSLSLSLALELSLQNLYVWMLVPACTYDGRRIVLFGGDYGVDVRAAFIVASFSLNSLPAGWRDRRSVNSGHHERQLNEQRRGQLRPRDSNYTRG